jgi:hypothetical protein
VTQINSNPNIVTNAAPLDDEELRDGFLRVEAEVRAIPEAELTPVNLEVLGAVSTALGALRKINQLRGDMVELKGMDISRLDKLRDFAFALGYAHSTYRGALGPTDPNSSVAEELVAIRDQLHTDALGLGKRKLLELSQVDKYRSGLGYKALASDVAGLVELIRASWAKISSKTAITEEELDHAASLAQRLLTGVGVKEQDPVALTAATLLRDQAFTAFISAYDEVRRAVSYLRWHEGDADSIAPSLWAGRTGKRPSAESEAPATNAPAAASVPAAPAAASVPVGFPGSSPFTS